MCTTHASALDHHEDMETDCTSRNELAKELCISQCVMGICALSAPFSRRWLVETPFQLLLSPVHVQHSSAHA